jgi:hypothetical protein
MTKISEIRPPEENFEAVFEKMTAKFKEYLKQRLNALPEEYKDNEDMRQRVIAIAHYEFDCMVAHSLRGLNGGLMPSFANYEKAFEDGEYAKPEYRINL